MPQDTINWDLLARTRDRIAAVGDDHCDMSSWTNGEMVGSGDPMCGTTACIAGHALAIHYGRYRQVDFGDETEVTAKEILGLPSINLFGVSLWPQKYLQIADDEGDAKGMIAICDALLDGTLHMDEDGFVESDA